MPPVAASSASTRACSRWSYCTTRQVAPDQQRRGVPVRVVGDAEVHAPEPLAREVERRRGRPFAKIAKTRRPSVAAVGGGVPGVRRDRGGRRGRAGNPARRRAARADVRRGRREQKTARAGLVGAGREDPVAPDDRRAEAGERQRRPPEDVAPGRAVPAVGYAPSPARASAVRPAKRRPLPQALLPRRRILSRRRRSAVVTGSAAGARRADRGSPDAAVARRLRRGRAAVPLLPAHRRHAAAAAGRAARAAPGSRGGDPDGRRQPPRGRRRIWRAASPRAGTRRGAGTKSERQLERSEKTTAPAEQQPRAGAPEGDAARSRPGAPAGRACGTLRAGPGRSGCRRSSSRRALRAGAPAGRRGATAAWLATSSRKTVKREDARDRGDAHGRRGRRSAPRAAPAVATSRPHPRSRGSASRRAALHDREAAAAIPAGVAVPPQVVDRAGVEAAAAREARAAVRLVPDAALRRPRGRRACRRAPGRRTRPASRPPAPKRAGAPRPRGGARRSARRPLAERLARSVVSLVRPRSSRRTCSARRTRGCTCASARRERHAEPAAERAPAAAARAAARRAADAPPRGARAGGSGVGARIAPNGQASSQSRQLHALGGRDRAGAGARRATPSAAARRRGRGTGSRGGRPRRRRRGTRRRRAASARCRSCR